MQQSPDRCTRAIERWSTRHHELNRESLKVRSAFPLCQPSHMTLVYFSPIIVRTVFSNQLSSRSDLTLSWYHDFLEERAATLDGSSAWYRHIAGMALPQPGSLEFDCNSLHSSAVTCDLTTPAPLATRIPDEHGLCAPISAPTLPLR
jgi:hypothetical protein